MKQIVRKIASFLGAGRSTNPLAYHHSEDRRGNLVTTKPTVGLWLHELGAVRSFYDRDLLRVLLMIEQITGIKLLITSEL